MEFKFYFKNSYFFKILFKNKKLIKQLFVVQLQIKIYKMFEEPMSSLITSKTVWV